MITSGLEELKGKNVVVIYSGVEYKGRLVDVMETEILLSDGNQVISLPFEGISSILRTW